MSTNKLSLAFSSHVLFYSCSRVVTFIFYVSSPRWLLNFGEGANEHQDENHKCSGSLFVTIFVFVPFFIHYVFESIKNKAKSLQPR